MAAICKKCRKEGTKLFLKGQKCLSVKCPVVRRASAPGQHGMVKKGRRPAEFGIQLREKQKCKNAYGIREKQMRLYFYSASKKKGMTGETLLVLLERRLDNVCYKLGFASSRHAARQLVTHGHICVNDKKLDIPSYLVQIKDVIGPKDPSKLQLSKNELPKWLAVNAQKTKGEVIKLPERDDLDPDIKDDLIVEFYSR